MIEDYILKIGSQVNFRGLDPRKVAEGIGRKRAGPVLHRPGKAVLLPRDLRQRGQRLEVELHVRDAPVRKHDTAV